MGNCSQCFSRGKEVWLTSLIGLAVSKRQVIFFSAIIYANFYFWILRWFTVSFSCFWILFWFSLDQPNSHLIVRVRIDISLRQVVICCHLKCPCHPMSTHRVVFQKYFFEIFDWNETLAQFSQELQPCFFLRGEACDFRKNHQEEAKSSLLNGEWKAGEAELGLALRALSQTLCLYVQEIFQNLSFCTMERFHHENGEQRFENTSTGISANISLAQSWIFASGMGFEKDATKKPAGLSEFIIRLLRDFWPVWQYQSVALKSETCWSEMLQCLDALYSGETKNAEPSVFNMPLRTGNTWERLVSTGVILASSHESIGEKSRHQLGSGPAAGSFCARECAEGGWIGYLYIRIYIIH